MSTKGGKKAAEDPAKTIEAVVSASQEASETVIKAATESCEQAFATAQEKVEEMVKGYDDVAEFGKNTMEAVAASGNAYAKGVEQLATDWFAFSKQSMEQGVAATRAMMGAKTPQEFFNLQTNFAKEQFDSMVSQSTKTGELATKVTQEALEPLNGRVSAAVEKWVKAAA